MANKIDVIEGINKELGTTVIKLEDVDKKVISISENLRKAVGGFSDFTLPKDLETSSKAAQSEILKLNQAVDEQRKLILKLQAEITKLSQKRTASRKKGIEQRVAETALRKELRAQVRAVTDLGSAYDNLSAKNNQLIRERQNLAVRQKTNNDLTVEETNRLEDLTNQIQENQRVLSTTDQEIGNFRRNVGNYASAYDGLGNSINQITRELPAFTNSIQTGFLAVSNNIPILADEIGRLNRVNAELIAQGKPTQSVFKQIAGAIFSWQTLLSVGVTLLTVYGKELVTLISSLFSTEKQLDRTKVAQQALNKAQIEAVKAVASEVSELQLLFDVAKDVTQSLETREKAVKKLIESSEGLITVTDKQNILTGKSIELEEKLIKQLINRGIVNALINQSGELFAKIAENRITLLEKEERAEKLRTELINTNAQALENNNRALNSGNNVISERAAKQAALAVVEKEISNLTEENNTLQEKSNAILGEASKISNEFTLGLTERSKAQKNDIKALKGSLTFLEQQISKLEEQRDKLAINSKEWRTYNVLIELAKEKLLDFQKTVFTIDLDPVGDQIQSSTQRIREALNNIFESTGDEDPLGDLTDKAQEELDQQIKDFEDAEKKKQELLKQSLQLQRDIRDEFTFAAIDGINSIFDAQIERYERDIEANNAYYENILENEELSEEQRTALEAQREEREQALRDKQREQEKKQFLFNQGLALADIAITLAKTISQINLNAQLLGPLLAPGYAATNIAFAIGTAAAQTATVLSQQLPQFAEGKNFNDNYEGPAIWGERKRELKISKNGTIEMSPKRIGNHLTYVKKDDVIIPDANKYLSELSDSELASNLNKHVYIANVANQNRISNSIKKEVNIGQKLDALNNTLDRKKFKFNLNQDMSGAAKEFAKQLKFINRKQNTL